MRYVHPRLHRRFRQSVPCRLHRSDESRFAALNARRPKSSIPSCVGIHSGCVGRFCGLRKVLDSLTHTTVIAPCTSRRRNFRACRRPQSHSDCRCCLVCLSRSRQQRQPLADDADKFRRYRKIPYFGHVRMIPPSRLRHDLLVRGDNMRASASRNRCRGRSSVDSIVVVMTVQGNFPIASPPRPGTGDWAGTFRAA